MWTVYKVGAAFMWWNVLIAHILYSICFIRHKQATAVVLYTLYKFCNLVCTGLSWMGLVIWSFWLRLIVKNPFSYDCLLFYFLYPLKKSGCLSLFWVPFLGSVKNKIILLLDVLALSFPLTYKKDVKPAPFISNIDIVYNITPEHHWGEGRDVSSCTLGGLANHNTLGQLTNLSPLRISEGGAS